MLSIQDVGLSIMGDSPKNLYFLCGTEYGIKEKYIDILVDKIGSHKEYSNILDFISLMTKNHIIPLLPQVYVVRYDSNFISKLNKELADTLLTLNIVGTLVVIYDDDKSTAKLDKFFPDNTAVINEVSSKYLAKYLKSDFPDLDKKVIAMITKYVTNYYQARLISNCLNYVKDTMSLSEKEFCTLFGIMSVSHNSDIQIAIADRNFVAYLHLLDNYDGDLSSIFYTIMNTMTELDKVLDNKYANSPVKKYVDKWSRADVYYMFNHTYNALATIRSGAIVNIYDVLIYLGALMKFKNIPNLEVLAG